MPDAVNCPVCGDRCAVREGRPGRRIECRGCGESFVPGAGSRPRKKATRGQPSWLPVLLLSAAGVVLVLGVGLMVLLPKPAPKSTDGPVPEVGLRPNSGPPTTSMTVAQAVRDIQGTRDMMLSDARVRWLLEQTPTDADRAAVCAALWGIREQSGIFHEDHQAAFFKWAGPDQANRLVVLAEAGNLPACAAAVRLKHKPIIPVLCKILASPHPSVHKLLPLLEEFEPAAVEQGVVGLLLGTPPDRIEHAQKLLAKWGTRPEVYVDAYLDALAHPEEIRGRAAIWALAKATVVPEKRAAVLAALRPHIYGRDESAACFAAISLGHWGTTENVPDLIHALQLPTEFAGKEQLVEVLFALNTEAGTLAIARYYLKPRVPAAKAVLARNAQVFEPIMVNFLRDPAQEARVGAVLCLKDIGTPGCIPALEAASRTDRTVAAWAREAVAQIRQRGPR